MREWDPERENPGPTSLKGPPLHTSRPGDPGVCLLSGPTQGCQVFRVPAQVVHTSATVCDWGMGGPETWTPIFQ